MEPQLHIFIAGGGGIGRAVSLLLLHEPSLACRVTIGDVDGKAATAAAEFAAAAGGSATPMVMPAEGTSPELAAVLESSDALLDCLPGAQAPRLARLARQHACHYLNLTEHVRETEEVLRIAEGASTCFALQCGLAPGVINVLGMHLVRSAQRAWESERLERLRLRVGALPKSAREPHFYGFSWSAAGVATEYVKPCVALRGGRVVHLPALSERASLIVSGLALEEDLTSGGAADLPVALAGDVLDLDYKTLRHPGHYAWVDRLLAAIPSDADRAGALQKAMEAQVPTCEDDRIVLYADVEGRDRAGVLRAKKVARVVDGIAIAGAPLSAIQSTTAAGLAEVLRWILARGRRGPLLQSQIPPQELLSGPFVRRAFGDLLSA